MKALVPMTIKSSAIHAGHIAVIEYAKSIANEVEASIIDLPGLGHYMIDGILPEVVNVDKQVESIKKLQVNILVREILVLSEEERIRLATMFTNFVKLYNDVLILDRYIKMAELILISGQLKIFFEDNWTKSDVIIRGPEISSFFLKSASKLLKWSNNIVILPSMIKDFATKIRCQSMIEKCPKEFLKQIPNFRKVVDDAKKFYKIGRNNDLEKELNYSYVDKKWNIHEIGRAHV